jgi:hypothetical protein
VKGEGNLMLKGAIIPSFLIMLMGSIDCLTTLMGVLYYHAAELNPFMIGIVGTNLGAFFVIKIVATMLVAFSFILANKILMETHNKSCKFFKYSCKLLKLSYAGIIGFLVLVVANNLLVLLA